MKKTAWAALLLVAMSASAGAVAQEQRDARRFLEDRQNAQFRSSSD